MTKHVVIGQKRILIKIQKKKKKKKKKKNLSSPIYLLQKPTSVHSTRPFFYSPLPNFVGFRFTQPDANATTR